MKQKRGYSEVKLERKLQLAMDLLEYCIIDEKAKILKARK